MIYFIGGARLFVFPNDSIANVGDSFIFVCMAEGIPQPYITWMRNGLSLNMEANITEERFSNDSSYFTMSTLNLCTLQFSDSGMYSCSASNIGTITDSVSFSLDVQGSIFYTLHSLILSFHLHQTPPTSQSLLSIRQWVSPVEWSSLALSQASPYHK